jgi:hypothetical protein
LGKIVEIDGRRNCVLDVGFIMTSVWQPKRGQDVKDKPKLEEDLETTYPQN